MKKLIIAAIVVGGIMALGSCGGAHKQCAAYAKHDTAKKDYSKVQ